MKPFPFYALVLLLLSTSSLVFAQDKCPVKFGKVAPEDFDLSKNKYDSSAEAVIIADVGSSSFEGNVKGWFSLLFKRQQRIKIINKNGLDAANIQIPYYIASTGNSEEKIENLKATTYNLVNGTVVETKLEADQIYKDKLTKNWYVKKFTMPSVTEGSIIEISYIIKSDFLRNLREWEFQGEYPRLWSEYQVNIPEFFNYVFLSQGSFPFFINKKAEHHENFNVTVNNGAAASEYVRISGSVFENRWVMKDIPSLKSESFISTPRNHIAKIEFQLSQYRFPNVPVEDVMGNWLKVADVLLNDEEFGATLTKANNWLDDELNKITAGSSSNKEKAIKIYEYVRENFTCTSYGNIYLSSNLKTIFNSKKGNEADINLLLIAMLRHEKITANPVMLSTRNHGYTHELYPLMDRFNYIIAQADIDNQKFYLDASEPMLGFGKLTVSCYNGHARIIDKTPAPVYLDTDSLKERKLTSVFISNNAKGEVEGSFQSTLGYITSLNKREKIKETGINNYFKNVQTSFGSEYNIYNTGIDSLKKYDFPIMEHYDFKMNLQGEDIIYLNPMMGEALRENPFKATQRFYPVEMPYTFDETFVFNMEIPKGYVVDELPVSAKVNFNDGEGYFEYLSVKEEDRVMMRSRFFLKRANFLPEEYEDLRAFYGMVVKKQAEQIVLKKKNP